MSNDKQPSDKLNILIQKANQSFGEAKNYVIDAYTQAIDEGFTPQEAKEYIDRVNVRLSQYKLNIVVNKKEQSLLEEIL